MPTTLASQMRVFLPLVVIGLAASSCRCAPATPTPVTLRINNAGKDALLVRDGKGQLGLTVQRNVNGQWFPFDDLPCECQTCGRICESGCRCPDAGISELVRTVPPNGQVERSWNGVVQVAGVSCNQMCLSPDNAPPDETFQLELCFVNQIDGVEPLLDGGRSVAAFPPRDVQTCVTRTFEPQQGVVEIGPIRGATCSTTADCRGRDELCLAGSCTSGCPSNSFPAQPELVVTFANMGFFSETREMDGRVLESGSGRITSTQFSGETYQVALSNNAGTGRVEIKLPGGLGGPSLPNNAQVSVLVAVRNDGAATYRGVTIRDAATGALLVAADTAIPTPTLTEIDLRPFVITQDAEAIGCRVDATCGRLVFLKQTITAPGASAVSVEPNRLGTVSHQSERYRFWNITAGQYPSTSECKSYRPYALWRERM